MTADEWKSISQTKDDKVVVSALKDNTVTQAEINKIASTAVAKSLVTTKSYGEQPATNSAVKKEVKTATSANNASSAGSKVPYDYNGNGIPDINENSNKEKEKGKTVTSPSSLIPIRTSDGKQITTQNRENEVTRDYFKKYVYKTGLGYDSDVFLTAYTAWLQDTYGKTGVEKFWDKAEKVVFNPDGDPLDNLQSLLDMGGMIPVIGEPADGVNAIIYYVRGDKANVALSAGSAIPFIGNGIAGIKLVKKGEKLLEAATDTTKKLENAADAYKGGSKGGNIESPALKDSPYNPNIVADRVKPPYKTNPAHDPKSPLFNPKKTPEPADAAQVYGNAVRSDMGTWYGKGTDDQIYRYFSDNAGNAHFSGTVTKESVPADILRELGIKY
jgi:hypothetical protein